MRTVGAALFIAIWPWLFERAIGLTNLLSGAILSSGITETEVAKLLAAGLGGAVAVGATSGFTAGFGLFLTIVVAVAASLLFLGLLLLKIVVSISTILLFVGMPFAARAVAGRAMDRANWSGARSRSASWSRCCGRCALPPRPH